MPFYVFRLEENGYNRYIKKSCFASRNIEGLGVANSLFPLAGRGRGEEVLKRILDRGVLRRKESEN